jgi:hypothetical protein
MAFFKSVFAGLLLVAPLSIAVSPKANAYPYFFTGYSQGGYGSYSLSSNGYYGTMNTYSQGNYSNAHYNDNSGNYSYASCQRIGRYINCSGY